MPHFSIIVLSPVYAESSLKATHRSQLQRLSEVVSGWVGDWMMTWTYSDCPTNYTFCCEGGRTNTVPRFYSKDSAN